MSRCRIESHRSGEGRYGIVEMSKIGSVDLLGMGKGGAEAEAGVEGGEIARRRWRGGGVAFLIARRTG